jgi:hypothetical protein
MKYVDRTSDTDTKKKQIQENRNNPYDVMKPIQGTRI